MINSVWWVGVVENRIDPLKLGRCQVRIFGHHTENKQELKTENLPWAHPVLPLNNSNPYAPKEGETVTGFFMDGEDAQFPVMLGVLSGIPVRKANETLGFNDPRTAEQLNTAPIKPGETATKYPRAIDEPTTPRAARNESMDKAQFSQKMNKVIQGSPEAPKKPKTVYPYNNVYESESGHLFEMDDTPKDERIHLYHRSGSYFEYSADGSVTEKVEAKKSETVRAGSTLYIGENLTVIVKGNANYQVDGDFSISCKNFSLSAKEAIGMSAGKSASISAKEDVGISAKKNIIASAKVDFTGTSKGGNMSLSADTGTVSVSAKKDGSFTADGPLTLESKAVAFLTAPMIFIGRGGAAGLGVTGDAADTALESMDKSLLEKVGDAAAGAISDTAGSFFSSTFESLGGFTEGLTEGLSGLAGFSGADVFGGLSDTLSQGGILGELASGFGDAFSGLTSFGGLSDAFSSITEGLKSGSLLDVIGTVKDAISDPLGTILNSDVFSNVMGDITDSLGESFKGFMDGFSFGSDGLGGGFSFDDLKEGFSLAKDLYETGIGIVNDPLGALSSIGGAADIFSQGSGGFLDGLKEAAFAVNDFINTGTDFLGSTFGEISSALNLNFSATNGAVSSIEPFFNSFLNNAQEAVFNSMPNVDGLSSVLSRVNDTLSTDNNFKYSMVSLVKTGKESGLSSTDITANLQDFMNSTYMNSVQNEMKNSPITFLNLMDATGATV